MFSYLGPSQLLTEPYSPWSKQRGGWARIVSGSVIRADVVKLPREEDREVSLPHTFLTQVFQAVPSIFLSYPTQTQEEEGMQFMRESNLPTYLLEKFGVSIVKQNYMFSTQVS